MIVLVIWDDKVKFFMRKVVEKVYILYDLYGINNMKMLMVNMLN